MAITLRYDANGNAIVPLASEFNEIDAIPTRLKLGVSKINVTGEFNEMANLIPHTYGASIADAMSLTDAVYGNRVWLGNVSETATSTDNISAVATSILYTPQAVNRTPQYGTTTYPSLTPPGWTSLVSSSQDDAYVSVPTPFNFYYNGTFATYAGLYPGSNGYVTFGSGSTIYSGVSVSNPAINKLLFGGGDWSWQLVSSYADPSNNYVRWRVEGNFGTSGTLGSPGIVYEAAVFNPAQTGGVTMFYITFGSVAPIGYSMYICSSSAALPGGGPVTIAGSTSYVFVGDSTATNWTIYSGYSVTNTTF